jgi:hypothetical protein
MNFNNSKGGIYSMGVKQSIGRVIRWMAAVAALVCSGAQRDARAVLVDLNGLGISSGFESPDADPNNDGAEQTVARNLGAGWTYRLLGGHTSDFGVQDPADGYYGTPLVAPFQGRQLGYFNLEPFSAGEVVSDSVGTITAGQTYTLNVGVGARNNATWSNLRYAIGLRVGSTDVGTFGTVDLDPGLTATNTSDLVFTLNVDTEAAAFIGRDAQIVIRGINLGTGVTPAGFSQANFDNVRLDGTFGAPNRALTTIDRSNGAISLSKTGNTNMNITGYSLTSAAGAFNSANWLSIANNYDKPSTPTPGNGSVDSDDAWLIMSAAGSKTDLSEAELESGGNGGTLSSAAAINLGNTWRKTPFQDVLGSLSLADGTVISLDVVYTGNPVTAGDLNGDGLINGTDWTAFKNGQGTNFTGLTAVESYLAGDLDGDKDHDLADFILFRNAYNAAHGAGSFGELLASVPEPCTLAILASAGLLSGVVFNRRTKRQRLTITMTRFCKITAILIWMIAVLAWTGSRSVLAQNVVSHWSFNSNTLTLDGSNNITVFGEQTGNHIATPGLGGTGGNTTGFSFVSQPFPAATSSITGQFGEGLKLAGNNFLLFNNLTELMQSAGAPNYTVSMWLKTETNGGATGTQFSTLANWGNKPVSAGPTRFTYGFGPASGTQMRTQTRRFNAASGNGGTDGSDIVATSVTTPQAINNSSWHMLTFTFNTTTGVLGNWFDGALVQNVTSTAPSFAMADSNSTVASIGLKADSGTFAPLGVELDEIWVFNNTLNATQVTNLRDCNDITGNSCTPTKLRIKVNTTTGNIVLENPTTGAIDLNSYQITSAGSSLDNLGWDGISEQTVSGFPVGNGSGNGWEAGPNANSKELVEWYLQGNSTFGVGQSINLGAAYNDAIHIEDLQFKYTTSTGGLVDGLVQYITGPAGVPGDYNGNGIVDAADYVVWRKGGPLQNEVAGVTPGQVTQEDYTAWRARFGNTAGIGSAIGNQTTVPEPAIGMLLLVGVGIWLSSRPRQLCERLSAIRPALMLLLTMALVAVVSSSAFAAYTADRIYHFGDDSLEGASAGIDVGSGGTNVSPNNTLDSQGPSGAFIDLATNGATGKPKYIDVSVTGADLAQTRPGASSGNLGILFDGVDDYLNGLRFNQPYNAAGTHLYTPSPGPNNYDGVLTRGFQVWVYPKLAGSTVAQHIVMDSRQHGLQTTTGGNWALVYNNNTVNSNVAINFNQWSHAMVAMPGSLPNREVLYVNGIAIAARQSNYSTNADPVGGENAYSLTVGASTGNTSLTVGTGNRFNGVVDELEMFVWGSTYDATANTITNLGQFSFATDNAYAATHLTGTPGDVNQSGSLTQADIDAFVANWLYQKLVNNVQVGDLTTILKGDLNFDGATNLQDMTLLRAAIAGASSGAGFDLNALNNLGVPEPSTLVLMVISLAAGCAFRRRRGTSHSSISQLEC